jgi:hypothetical protein
MGDYALINVGCVNGLMLFYELTKTLFGESVTIMIS